MINNDNKNIKKHWKIAEQHQLKKRKSIIERNYLIHTKRKRIANWIECTYIYESKARRRSFAVLHLKKQLLAN